MADPFPLYVPPEARRPFQSESLLRRFAHQAHWAESSKLLELHGTMGGLALAKGLQCPLTIAESDSRMAEHLKDRAKAAGITGLVNVQVHNPADASQFDDAFDGIFCLGRVLGHLNVIASRFRPLLAAQGRLALTTVVRVGRAAPPSAMDAWEKRLGRPLLTPRDAMMSFEAEGFEPELCDSMGEGELDEYYKELEALMARANTATTEGLALTEEIALHRAHFGKGGYTYALIVARRKEPGERPPISRDGG